MAELAPLSSSLPQAIVLETRPRTAFGSIAIAMCIGALLAVAALYFWGAQVAQEERRSAESSLVE